MNFKKFTNPTEDRKKGEKLIKITLNNEKTTWQNKSKYITV
jgi:hypothetical protein